MNRIIASLIPLLFLAGGCATPGASLRLSTPHDNVQYVQNFAQAYIGQAENGDLQAVLIDEPLPAAPQNQAVLTPAPAPPLRQVVYLHILWRPLNGAKSDNPSAANATLDWYVTPAGALHGEDLLHYQGAAFVMVYGSGDNLTLEVRNATIKPVEIRGQMSDPIGQATLRGTITARTSATRVNQVLAEVRSLETFTQDARADATHPRIGSHPNPPSP